MLYANCLLQAIVLIIAFVFENEYKVSWMLSKTDKISTWCETETLLSFQRRTPEGVYKFPMCFEN